MSVNEPSLSPQAATAIIEHMNGDHADAVLGYVHRFGALPAATSARMSALESAHMSIDVEVDGAVTTIEIPFPHPLRDAADARDTLIAMARPPSP